MRVAWTPEAAQDRRDIWDFLFEKNPQAAADMDRRFSSAVLGWQNTQKSAHSAGSQAHAKSFLIQATALFTNLSPT